ncbi:hypothetical protein HK102_001842 [Quaeritorhiza haematococci]|nr:hypothetical protein HK102_001842 [Quaeritorhiza haematococci]
MNDFRRFVDVNLDDVLAAAGDDAGETVPRRVHERMGFLVNKAIESVPAYKAIAEKYQLLFGPSSTFDFDTFLDRFPYLDKNNFVHEYPHEQRCVDGNLIDLDFLHVSSGR